MHSLFNVSLAILLLTAISCADKLEMNQNDESSENESQTPSKVCLENGKMYFQDQSIWRVASQNQERVNCKESGSVLQTIATEHQYKCDQGLWVDTFINRNRLISEVDENCKNSNGSTQNPPEDPVVDDPVVDDPVPQEPPFVAGSYTYSYGMRTYYYNGDNAYCQTGLRTDLPFLSENQISILKGKRFDGFCGSGNNQSGAGILENEAVNFSDCYDGLIHGDSQYYKSSQNLESSYSCQRGVFEAEKFFQDESQILKEFKVISVKLTEWTCMNGTHYFTGRVKPGNTLTSGGRCAKINECMPSTTIVNQQPIWIGFFGYTNQVMPISANQSFKCINGQWIKQ